MIRSALSRIIVLAAALGAGHAVAAEEGSVDPSAAAVRSLLASRCGKCHDDATAKGGLSLASAAGLLAGGDSGPAIVPGKPEESLLLAAVGYADDRVQMPPDGKLSAAEIKSLGAWVRDGALWPDGGVPAGAPVGRPASRRITDADRAHWAFQPVVDAAPPEVADEAWPRGALDRFILASLNTAGLSPSAPADKWTLLRRATFDLTGLPPTPEELADFLADESPEAFDTVIERLLASPRYGERWGRHWLDVVRYADARDLIQLPPESDFREAWRYRDWVIDAFNRDLPYTDFLSRQIAGDLLQPDDPGRIDAEALVATGFLAIADFVPGDVDKERMIADCVNDQIDVVSRAFLGLSLACARCHDHKFDPVSTDDYHALAGIFFSTRVIPGPVKGNTPLIRVPLLPASEIAALEAQAAADRKRLDALAGLVRVAREAEHRRALEAIVVADSARACLAAWDLRAAARAGLPTTVAAIAAERQLDEKTLDRWLALLDAPPSIFAPLAAATEREAAVRFVAALAEHLAAEGAKREARRTDPARGDTHTNELFRFHADDPGLVVDPAGRVVAWPDRDGLADDALSLAEHAAPTLATTILGGRERPVVRFDGGTILAAGREVPAVGALTVLFRPAADAAPGQRLLGWEDAAVGQHGVGLIAEKTGALHAILRHGSGNGDIVVGPAPEGVFQLVTLAWGPGGTKLFRNGKLAGSNAGLEAVSSAPDIRALRIGGAGSGAGPSFRGDVAELRVVAGALDDAARGRIEAEIRARWLDEASVVESAGSDSFEFLTGSTSPFARPAAERDAWLESAARERIESLRAEHDALATKPAVEIPRAVVVQDGGVPETRHAGFQDAAVFIRGNPANRGHIVPRGFPRVLVTGEPTPIGAGSGRRELAAWLSSPSHPLTARVMVNRLWQHHFGAGIVPVEGGFGLRGEPPSHPALLDHLASRLIESGWSMKAMHRLMMRSSTYRQGSRADAATLAADPSNRLLGRMPRQRLEAEAIRDAYLAVSGRLETTPGGPAFSELMTPRRSLYLMATRTGAKTTGFGSLFDGADCGAIVEARKTSTVAPQALFLLNDPFILDLADALAARISLERPEGDLQSRLERLHALLFGRLPSDEEVSLATRFLAESGSDGWARLCHLLLCSNEFIHVD